MYFLKLLIVIFFSQVFCDNIIYYKKNLHNLYTEQLNKLIPIIIKNEYEFIYKQIINNAIIGLNELKFTIFCGPIFINNLYQLNKEFILNGGSEHNKDELPIHMYKDIMNILSKNNFTNKVLDKIKQTFPDIYITISHYYNFTDNLENDYRKCNFNKIL